VLKNTLSIRKNFITNQT